MSTLRPSGAERFMSCPGSVRDSENLPRTSSVYADEGTAAHRALELWVQLGVAPSIPEQVEHLQSCRDYLLGPRVILGVEEKLHILPDYEGTADYVTLEHDGSMGIVDLKYGVGVPVDPVRNAQLLSYALGARKRFGEVWAYKLTILQPRCPHPLGPVRTWDISNGDLDLFEADLKAAIRKTKAKKAVYATGDHCRWCPAKATCQVLSDHIVGAAAPGGKLRPVDGIPVGNLPKLLEMAELIPAWADAVKARARGLVESGQEILGWGLVPGRKSRAWQDGFGPEGMSHNLGLELADVTDTTILSPAQAEKKFSKLGGWSGVAANIITREGAPIFKRISDHDEKYNPGAVWSEAAPVPQNQKGS